MHIPKSSLTREELDSCNGIAALLEAGHTIDQLTAVLVSAGAPEFDSATHAAEWAAQTQKNAAATLR